MENTTIFKLILEQFRDGIIILDANDNIIFINEMARNIRHISNNIIGKNILLCHPEHSRDKVIRALKYIKEKRESFTRMVRDQKNDKVFENSYRAVINADQNVLGSVVISKDITDKHKLETDKLRLSQLLQGQVVELTDKLNNLFLSSLTVIVNTLEAKDPYTNGHSMRVTNMSKTFTEHIYGQIQLLTDIEIAGRLHDVGKIGIKESILNKPDKLTPEEFEQMKMHPIITEQILSPIISLKEIVIIAKHHHERFDGRGYPSGLKGEEIPLGSRILALADAYDAMTSSRPYRKALDSESAIFEIQKNLGTQFDPEIGEKFINMVETGTIG